MGADPGFLRCLRSPPLFLTGRGGAISHIYQVSVKFSFHCGMWGLTNNNMNMTCLHVTLFLRYSKWFINITTSFWSRNGEIISTVPPLQSPGKSDFPRTHYPLSLTGGSSSGCSLDPRIEPWFMLPIHPLLTLTYWRSLLVGGIIIHLVFTDFSSRRLTKDFAYNYLLLR